MKYLEPPLNEDLALTGRDLPLTRAEIFTPLSDLRLTLPEVSSTHPDIRLTCIGVSLVITIAYSSL